jgi:hypothetical protein
MIVRYGGAACLGNKAPGGFPGGPCCWCVITAGSTGLAYRLPLRPMPPRAQRHAKSIRRARAQKRLPAEVRQQLVDAIYAGQSFRSVLRDLTLTPNQVWGMASGPGVVGSA